MKNKNVCAATNVWVVVALFGLAPVVVQAADRPANFKVSNEQVHALDIQTASIQGQSESIRASFPAQVVVPAAAEQIVSSPVAGLVTQLLVQQFQPVKAGTPLLRIVSPELGQLQLQLIQASSRATLARQAAQREQQLFDEGIIPQRRVLESQAALKEAEAVLAQATAALRLSGLSAATISAVAASGKPVDSLTLAAERAGIVTEITVKPGQRVEAATVLLRAAQTGSLWLEVLLPAAEIMNWSPKTRIEVADRGITARVVSISPTVAAGSQTLMLRAVVEGKTGSLRPGELVTVALPVGTVQGGWDVPLPAVTHDGKQAYVFARTADGFEARPVNIIASAGQRTRVQGSLKLGEQIAISGIVALKGAWLKAGEAK